MPLKDVSLSSFSFSKRERISSKLTFKRLISSRTTLFVYPFKCYYLSLEKENRPHAVAISVPKRNLKSAVHRNRVKRLVRESYRLNKQILYRNIPEKSMNMLFLYVAKEVVSYQTISCSIEKLLGMIVSAQNMPIHENS